MLSLGVVAIGRNEGERLRRCLASAAGKAPIVYVDSGSADGSVALAREMGVDVVELDMSRPFTAARARNAGLEELLAKHPEVELVQFVDGDCEIVDGWFERGLQDLAADERLAAVSGRCRERYPEKTVYNKLCDLEWDTPVGDAKACGGNALMRVAALREVGSFNPEVIAGEEPELCVRLRRAGWKIRRIDAEMVLHDAGMTVFGQWWRRGVRCGYGYAEGAEMHGAPPERHCVRDCWSARVWGLILPLVALLLAVPTRGASLAILALYPLQAWRIIRKERLRGRSPRDARIYAWHCILAKFPHALGLLKYRLGRLTGRRSAIIEYRTIVPSSGDTVGTVLARSPVLVALCGAAFLVLFWPAIVGLVRQWTADPDFSHGFLLPVIAAGILWSRREEIAGMSVRGPGWGFVLLAASLVLFYLGLQTLTDFFQRIALVGALCGAVVAVSGTRVLVRHWFPFFLLLFAVPPPAVLFDPFRLWLKEVATRLSAEGLIAVGVPAMPEGTVLRIGPRLLEVADACSGIRSLIAITTAAVLFAWVFRTGPVVGALVVATAIPVTVFVNVLRIVVVALTLHGFGVDLSAGHVHEVLGILVMALSLVLIYWSWRFYEWMLRGLPAEARAT